METNEITAGKGILVVDDSKEARRQLIEVYLSIGLEVVGEAKNGLEALEILSTTRPDFVSIDIIMPEMNGLDLYSAIKQKFPTCKSFFCSALSKGIKGQEAYQKSIPSLLFLEKPIDLDELHICLTHLSKTNS